MSSITTRRKRADRQTVADPLTGVRASAAPAVDFPRSNGKRDPVEKVVAANRGIILDVGCGLDKYNGAVGMDKQDLPGVDVVHDWDAFPWPFEDESVLTIIASHVVEHVDPLNGHFLRWLDECWRILRVNGQMAIVTPYAGSSFYWMDPTHVNGCTERTWFYLDPGHPSLYWQFYRPKPWWIEECHFNVEGMIEAVLRKREDDPKFYEHTNQDIPARGTGV